MYVNRHHKTIQQVRELFDTYIERIPEISKQVRSPVAHQLETALANTNNASFKIIHPLLIKGYRMPAVKFRTSPLNVVGLDLETDATNGNPKLIGFWFPSQSKYIHLYNPTLKRFFELVREVSNNAPGLNFITWGNLDIQCIIRLFGPDATERQAISRGIGANFQKGKFIGTPPIMRTFGRSKFYISHYISGRSLKLGIVENEHESTVWIFNCSQFYPGRIADTAKGLGLEWVDFPKDTHIIDWQRFVKSPAYKTAVFDSNRQDARIVCELAANLQARFYDVFKCYPTLLVSTGSLTDAAVSKMLSSEKAQYQSNSWRWLTHNVWKGTNPNVLAQAESLLAEAFSAGYVDQFSVGFFDRLCTADIAAAYPHKIRSLPDLRYAVLLDGSSNLDVDLVEVSRLGYELETAVIRGKVCIPDSLTFHPITVKTYSRENWRPTGEFYATYTLDERKFCEKYGASFSEEEYIIVALTERHKAPIAEVSETLGRMRAELLAQIDCKGNEKCNKCKLLDGQQYLVKVIDNSIYGKTVMTTEVVENINGAPQITGYIAGDRFNLLYGSLITARTRIQIAEACMSIVAAGGRPVMTMTDSIYWHGSPDMLPDEMVRAEKTPGYFETPQTVSEFFLIKTGQYEFKTGNKWSFKKRGLNIVWDDIDGKASFFRRTIKKHCAELPPYIHPKDIVIPVHTRRLITVGAHDLSKLAAIEDEITDLKPFILSSKQVERYVTDWRKCLDGHIWLKTPCLSPQSKDKSASDYPLTFLRDIYASGVQATFELTTVRNYETHKRKNQRLDETKRYFIWKAVQLTGMPIPAGRCYRLPWHILETYFGLARTHVLEGFKP